MSDLNEYDVILVDTPPALVFDFYEHRNFADYLLLPCSPDLAFRGRSKKYA